MYVCWTTPCLNCGPLCNLRFPFYPHLAPVGHGCTLTPSTHWLHGGVIRVAVGASGGW